MKRATWPLAMLALVAGALLPHARSLDSRLETAARVDGSESAGVEADLQRRFASPFTRSVLLVAQGLPHLEKDAGPVALGEIVRAVRSVPGVTSTFSYLDTREADFLSPDGHGTYVLVGLEASRPVEPVIADLRAKLRALGVLSGLELELTGGPALNVDLRTVSAQQVRAAERRALPLTLLLLFLAFRAPLAAALPLLTGGLTIGLALGAAALLSRVVSLSLALTSTVSMIGLGLSIDYALLVVHRFREARAAGRDVAGAVRETRRHAGSTLLLSGSAVGVGFLGLLASPLNELRSIGVGGLLAVAFSVLLAGLLVPALLEHLGPWLDRGGPTRTAGFRAGFWGHWAQRVSGRPGLTLLVVGLPLLVLAAQAARYRPGLPQVEWLPASAPAAQALTRLRAMGHGGLAHELRVVIDLPGDASALSVEGFEATRRTAAALAADSRIAHVRWLGNVSGEERELSFASLVPYAVKRLFVDEEGSATLLFVTPRSDVDPNEIVEWVRTLRARPASELSGLPGTRVRFGGLPALSADYGDAVLGGLPRSVAFVLIGSALLLLVALRAPLLALKAVLLNLLTVAAALGAVVLVFQDGYGVTLLGVPAPLGRLFPALPALVFGTVFGLSLDYEVFLLARLREGRTRLGLEDRAALAFALERTGSLITSAAAVMVAIFAAFMLGEFLLIKVLGFALATAVLLDATVVRLALGPALVVLAGRFNWWPAEASPLVPPVRLDPRRG